MLTKSKVNLDNTVFKKVGSLFKKRNTTENLLKLDYITYETENNNTAHMVFMFGNGDRHHMRLARKFNNGKETEHNIYFDNGYDISQGQLDKDNEFVKIYYDQIIYILDTIEKWHRFLNMEIYQNVENKQSFTFDAFRLIISYSDTGNIKFNIVSDPQVKDLFSKNWLGKPSINSIIEENSGSLLKKIPIRKSDLNKVLTDLSNTNEHNKIMQLTK